MESMSEDFCEMCGKKAFLKKYDIDGAIVEACHQCGKYGKLVTPPKTKTPYTPRWGPDSGSNRISSTTSRVQSSPTRQTRQKRSVRVKTELMLVDNYGRLIANAREKAGFDRKELARQIKETESLILRIEQEKIRPDDSVVKKLEKYLRIKLKTTQLGALSSAEFMEKPGSRSMTLGDIVRIKKKKEK
ncbi:MAG: multiprotein bridging factor aMBF1 [Candidatus Hodarchaeales archaeon]|jgi:putative transcription factor